MDLNFGLTMFDGHSAIVDLLNQQCKSHKKVIRAYAFMLVIPSNKEKKALKIEENIGM